MRDRRIHNRQVAQCDPMQAQPKTLPTRSTKRYKQRLEEAYLSASLCWKRRQPLQRMPTRIRTFQPPQATKLEALAITQLMWQVAAADSREERSLTQRPL